MELEIEKYFKDPDLVINLHKSLNELNDIPKELFNKGKFTVIVKNGFPISCVPFTITLDILLSNSRHNITQESFGAGNESFCKKYYEFPSSIFPEEKIEDFVLKVLTAKIRDHFKSSIEQKLNYTDLKGKTIQFGWDVIAELNDSLLEAVSLHFGLNLPPSSYLGVRKHAS